MSYPPIKLPDDPLLALAEVAGYLRSARTERDRKHYERTGPEGLGREFVGYWQTSEWFQGLAELAAEADRISGASK